MPLIAITPWRRTLPTWLHPETDLYTLAPFYVDGVERAGATVVIAPWVADETEAERVIERIDGLVLSGGVDIDPEAYGHPNEASVVPATSDRRGITTDTNDLLLYRTARAADLPVLAICRGLQLVNVAEGGTLEQHVWGRSAHHPARADTGDPTADADAFLANRHPVRLEPDSIVRRRFGADEISTNSMHHQAVDALGHGLRVTGRAPDGIVEALESDDGRVVGVQWHPERLADEGHSVLFEWLVEEAHQ